MPKQNSYISCKIAHISFNVICIKPGDVFRNLQIVLFISLITVMIIIKIVFLAIQFMHMSTKNQNINLIAIYFDLFAIVNNDM